MCGILGIYNVNGLNDHLKDKMITACGTMKHRGPDEYGYWYDKNNIIALGHRRLSIIDLKSGQQPMMNQKRNLVITYNGEIYNFPELKKELADKGYIFNTNSDTEVVLNLYCEYGVTGLGKLNGIFAFGIYDIEREELIIARDIFGVKPLYYIEKNGIFTFASEIKALLELNIISKEISIQSLNTNIAYRFNPSPRTLFKDIFKVQPGVLIKISKGEKRFENITKYFPIIDSEIEEDEAVELYKIYLKKAVKRQMLSDVPVGMLLSGGVDSALICSLMQELSSRKVNTYTVGFEGKGRFNELDYARITSDLIGTAHNELLITEKEYFDFFSKSFYFLEEPIAITSTTSLYFIDKLASRDLKVVLSGQGADELWGGYNRYIAENIINNYKHLLHFVPAKIFSKFFRNNEGIIRFLEAKNFKNNIERFNEIFSVFNYKEREHLLKPEYLIKKTVYFEILENLYEQTHIIRNSLSKLLYIDTRLNLGDCLLLLADKMSMANSLEFRVPYLDIELVRFIESLPAHYKVKSFKTKYLHKLLAKKILPAEIIKRKKIGFETPMNNWLRNDLGNYLQDLINADDSFSGRYLNLPYINKLIKNHKLHKENNERKLFIILTLEKWYQEFFSIN